MSKSRTLMIPEEAVEGLADRIHRRDLYAYEAADELRRWTQVNSPDIEKADPGDTMQVPVSVLTDMMTRVFDTEIRREKVLSAFFDLMFFTPEIGVNVEKTEGNENYWFEGVEDYPLMSEQMASAIMGFKDDNRTFESLKVNFLMALGMSYSEAHDRIIEEIHRRYRFRVVLPFDPEDFDKVKDWYNTYRSEIDHEVSMMLHGVKSPTGRNYRCGLLSPRFEGAAIVVSGMGYRHENSLSYDLPDFFDLSRRKVMLEVIRPGEGDPYDPDHGFKPLKR